MGHFITSMMMSAASNHHEDVKFAWGGVVGKCWEYISCNAHLCRQIPALSKFCNRPQIGGWQPCPGGKYTGSVGALLCRAISWAVPLFRQHAVDFLMPGGRA